MENLALMLLRFAALVPAIMLHEIAHGYAALRCGDTTARDAGRLSLNPLRHVDPFMSVVLPAVLVLSGSSVVFGGAKPVPINLPDTRLSLYLVYFLISYVVTNVALMVFNLVPVPPLDGSRVVTVLLPPDLRWRYAQLERWGMFIVFALLWLPAFNAAIGRAMVAVCRALGMGEWLWLLLLGR